MRIVVKRNWTIKKSIYAVIKRIIGFILALFGLIIASPIMLIIAVAIKLDSEGPVIFKQERTGKGGKLFKVYKFRTMVANNDVHDFSKGDEPTIVGNFLRKTSLDEIPQLFNILLGQMAFIGPRPWIQDYYDNMTRKQKHRVDVLPGITGLAQTKGRNNLTIFDKINYDLEYIDNYSLLEDIKVIWWTIKTVFSCAGADAGKGTIANELDLLKTQEIDFEDMIQVELQV